MNRPGLPAGSSIRNRLPASSRAGLLPVLGVGRGRELRRPDGRGRGRLAGLRDPPLRLRPRPDRPAASSCRCCCSRCRPVSSPTASRGASCSPGRSRSPRSCRSSLARGDDRGRRPAVAVPRARGRDTASGNVLALGLGPRARVTLVPWELLPSAHRASLDRLPGRHDRRARRSAASSSRSGPSSSTCVATRAARGGNGRRAR